MNALDIVILIPLAWGIFIGYRKGFVKQIGGLIFLIAGIWVAVNYSKQLNSWFSFAGEVSGIVAFIFIIVCAVLLGVLTTWLLKKLLEKMTLGTINKIAGGFFGLIKYGLVLSLVLKIMVSIGEKFPKLDVSSRDTSIFYPFVSQIGPFILPEMEKTLNFLVEKNNAPELDKE